MRYKLLGRSGLRVSEICLGTGTFGWAGERAPLAATPEESQHIFKAFVEAGGNFLDTANFYAAGGSERFIGDAVASDRDWFVIGSKYTLAMRRDDPNSGGNHRKALTQALDASLRRLKTDFMDLYWVHGWDFTTPIDELMRALDDAVRMGKVLYVGVSNTPAWIVARSNTLAELQGWTSFVGLQIEYSLVQRAPERELLPMAKALGIGVAAWSPLGMGILTAKYNRDARGSAREGQTSQPGRLDHPGVLADTLKTERNLRIAAEVRTIAEQIGRSPSQVALSWLRQQGVIPIVGARTTAQIRENLGCCDLPLDSEQLRRLDAVSGIERGFPHEFLETQAHPLIFGDTLSRLDRERR